MHVSVEPESMGMSASDSYASIGLDKECRVLACQQVYGRLTRVHRARAGRRMAYPADAMSSHILHHSMPEPCTVWTYSGLLFIEGMFFVFNYCRDVNH